MAAGSRAPPARPKPDAAPPAEGARVVVYGLTTEGYGLARPMAVAGADVWIVDESTPSAIEIKPEVARTYPDVHSLRTDEPLLSLVPIDTAISRAQYLFFAPRLRASRDDHGAELGLKLKDAASKLPRGSAVVYCLPVGLGGSSDLVTLVEHTTGYEAGAGVSYYYYPLGGPAGPPDAVGSAAVPSGSPAAPPGAADEVLAGLLAAGDGREREFVPLKSAESVHAIRVMSHFLTVHSMLEVYRLARGGRGAPDRGAGGEPLAAEYDSVFVDDMVTGMYDLMVVHGTLEHSSTALSQINSSAKAVVAYKKHVADTVRRIVRAGDLKASRTKVVVSWRFDPRTMRTDKARAAGMLVEMLHDHITDVELHNWFDADAAEAVSVSAAGAGSVYRSDKTIILVACTEADLGDALELGDDRDMIIVKANAACEAIDMLSKPHAGQSGDRRVGGGPGGGAPGRKRAGPGPGAAAAR